jgi:nucleoside-diphosphate-sugar epimerase
VSARGHAAAARAGCAEMRRALVFGGSGQIGWPLLSCLHDAGWEVVALSRQRRDDGPLLRWLQGGFEAMPALPAQVDAVFSCGPLDRFARWYESAGIDAARVVAFGSTSVEVKRTSPDACERDLARRLEAGEAGVFAAAQMRGAQVTVLRPTLVYGLGADHTLTRIARLARRWRRLPLPADATGLRQPVHVGDLAAAALAACGSAAAHGRTYAVPGGEALEYREMVARVLAVLEPPARVVELPPPLFRGLLAAAQAAGIARGLGGAVVARMREDLVFDAAPARRDFGYAPRPFMPSREMFCDDAPRSAPP